MLLTTQIGQIDPAFLHLIGRLWKNIGRLSVSIPEIFLRGESIEPVKEVKPEPFITLRALRGGAWVVGL
jgi:hypothetical protein